MTDSNLTSSDFRQIAVGITHFLTSPPASTPKEVIDKLWVLKNSTDYIADKLAAKAIDNIKSRDQVFKEVAGLVEKASSLASQIQALRDK